MRRGRIRVIKAEVNSVLVDAPEIRTEAGESEWWDRHRNLIAPAVAPAPLLRVPRLPRDNGFRLSLFLNSASPGAGTPARLAWVFRVAGISAARALGNGG